MNYASSACACLAVVLPQLEDLADDALASKTAAANQQQRKQAPQPVDTTAAAAALLAAEHPDLDQHTGKCVEVPGLRSAYQVGKCSLVCNPSCCMVACVSWPRSLGGAQQALHNGRTAEKVLKHIQQSGCYWTHHVVAAYTAGDGQQELLGDQHTQQTQQTQHGHMQQEQDQQAQQHWQVQQQQWPLMDVAPGGLTGSAQQYQQQQEQEWRVAGHHGYGVSEAAAGAWGDEPPISDSQQQGTLGRVGMWEDDQQQQVAGHQWWLHAAGKGLWEGEQGCVDTGDDGLQQGARGAQDGRTAWCQQSQQVQPVLQQQRQQKQQGMQCQTQTQPYDAWGMHGRQDSAGPQHKCQWHPAAPADATVAAGLGLTQAVGEVSHGAERIDGGRGGGGRLQVSGGAFPGPAPRPATAAPAIPTPSGRRRMSGSVAASLF